MDVKHTSFTALQVAVGLAHVAPEKGQQGDFEHWQRIFDASDRADTAERPPSWRMTDSRTQNMPACDVWRQAGGMPPTPQTAHYEQPARADQGLIQGRASPSVQGKISRVPVALLASPADAHAGALAAERMSAPKPTQAIRTGERKSTMPDGRPLAQLEAHLSRSTDGRWSVALRSNQPLSTAQALHAVAHALTAQERGSASVDLILLNGQPIYRSAPPAAHRFEIDC